MKTARKAFEIAYDVAKWPLFLATWKDPEKAHELFIKGINYAEDKEIAEWLFENGRHKTKHGMEVSPAAGMIKNGEIAPRTQWHMGFDRAMYGTLLAHSNPGNERPRTWRYPSTKSLVNHIGLQQGLPDRIRDDIWTQDYRLPNGQTMPLTISFMSLKTGSERQEELAKIIDGYKDHEAVDRFELNISCPNTHSENGKDPRDEYRETLDEMLQVTDEHILPRQALYIKISPDMTPQAIDDLLDVAQHHAVHGFTATNTTKQHDPEHIRKSPGRGGASGQAVYWPALRTHEKLVQKIKERGRRYDTIGVGGIDSYKRMLMRNMLGASGVQLYTGFIYKGLRVLDELKEK